MGKEKEKYRDDDSMVYTRHAMQIALLIKHKIEEGSLNKQEFSERIGKSASEISKWLSGNQNFTIRTLSKIENALGIEIVKSFSREELGLKGNPIRRNVQLNVVHSASAIKDDGYTDSLQALPHQELMKA